MIRLDWIATLARIARHTLTILAAGLLVLGCSKTETSSGDKSFDDLWAAQQQKPLVIEGEGAALGGNVRRATDEEAPVEAAPVEAAAALPGALAVEDVSSVVRNRVSDVRNCYKRATRDAPVAGRAVRRFDVAPEGTPAEVAVMAPKFQNTSLAACVRTRVKRWQFPASEKGRAENSYPFILAGQ